LTKFKTGSNLKGMDQGRTAEALLGKKIVRETKGEIGHI
jgi:hypothetical protein